MSKINKFFIFMDESGNNNQDRFFVLGILLIPIDEIGELFNFLENISSKIKNRSKALKHKRINEFYKNNDINLLLQYATSVSSFEIKFKSINLENEDLYIHILHKYFKQKNYKFYSMVIDKENNNPKFSTVSSYWNNYLNEAAQLISKGIKNTGNPEFVIIADQITQSKNDNPYEKYLSDRIYEILKVRPFGVMRIESHSSTFLQLVDIFVGAVSYDFIGKDNPRKLNFMKVLRKYLNIKNKIGKDTTILNPNTFSVLQMKRGSWL